MRVLILTASLLLLQLGISVEALACRGPFRSVQEITENSAHIFTAVVTKRDAGNQGTEPVELRITSVLKGKPPQHLAVDGRALIHPNNICGAIERGAPIPHAEIGDEWLVSGNSDENQNFVPLTGGNFRLANAHDGSWESKQKIVDEFRKKLSSYSKNNKATSR